MSKHKHEWIFAVRSGAALKASDAFICNVPGCEARCDAAPKAELDESMPLSPAARRIVFIVADGLRGERPGDGRATFDPFESDDLRRAVASLHENGGAVMLDDDVHFEPQRFGIVIVDPAAPDEAWSDPLYDEDSTPSPTDPEDRTALFATKAEAEAGVARRMRYEVRPLPPKGALSWNVSLGKLEPGKPCPLCGEAVKADVKHYCPSGLSAPREKQEQAMSFAWGNLAASTNHRPTEEVFRKLAADRYGWTDADFDAWRAKNTPEKAPNGCKCGSAFTACPVPGAPHKPAGALR